MTMTMKLSLLTLFFVALCSVVTSASASAAARANQSPLHATAATNAAAASIPADSELGMKLLSQARRVEENNNEGEENGEQEGGGNGNDDNNQNNNNVDVTWVAGYSIKFQGCHHIMQWNDDEDGDEDVRLMAKRLVRFRLCPTSSCSSSKAAGCKSGYGDYVLDLYTFLQAFYEAKTNAQETECNNYLANNCDCNNNNNNGGDDNNAERRLDENAQEGEEEGADGDDAANDCEYDCFMEADMYGCLDADDDFNPEDYMGCAGVGGDAAEERRRRKLEQDGGENDNGNGGQEYDYYVGPYCSQQGGGILLGMFTDDTCTEFADVSYYSVTGQELPYENESIVGPDCLSCAEQADGGNDGNDDGNNDADYTSEQCELLYTYAGKCESNLPSGTVDEPVTNGCAYMNGIQITREDGIVQGGTSPSPVATTFIVLFALLFACLAFYVYYLRMRLGVKKDALL